MSFAKKYHQQYNASQREALGLDGQSEADDGMRGGSRVGGQREGGQQVQQAQWLEDQCRQAMKRSMRTAAETNDLSQRTAEELNHQTEQIGRIHKEAEDISQNLDTSQYLINGMKSWWGTISQVFTAPPEKKPAPNTTDPSQAKGGGGIFGGWGRDGSTSSGSASSTATSAPRAASAAPRMGSSVAQATVKRSKFDEEIDADLDQLSGMLGEMHSRALEIGNTIDKQNLMLDSVHNTVDRNNQRISRQMREMDILMGRRKA